MEVDVPRCLCVTLWVKITHLGGVCPSRCQTRIYASLVSSAVLVRVAPHPIPNAIPVSSPRVAFPLGLSSRFLGIPIEFPERRVEHALEKLFSCCHRPRRVGSAVVSVSLSPQRLRDQKCASRAGDFISREIPTVSRSIFLLFVFIKVAISLACFRQKTERSHYEFRQTDRNCLRRRRAR